jgi:tetratricopeptide (TPR) repeat protein
MIFLRVFFIACVANAAVAVARAQSTPASNESAQARSYFDKGMAHYHLEEYAQAIDKWEAGFRIKPAPEFLYNIAQAYRLSNKPERALAFYQKYLRMNPKADNRPEVERHIATLRPIVDQQRPAAAAPPVNAIPPPAPAETARAPQVETKTPSTSRADLTATAARPRPVYQKAWFWGVVGGAAMVVAAAVIVGVVVGTSGDSAKSLPDVRF